MYKLNFVNSTNRYTKEDLLNNIEKVWNFHKRQPVLAEMNCFPSTICFGTYFNRFGSWKKALKEFVLYKNNGKLMEETERKTTVKRRSLNNSLRYDVMKRDKFKCKLCGKSPATHADVILEVDHIKSSTKGGGNSLDNLRTLCRICNNGKRNK